MNELADVADPSKCGMLCQITEAVLYSEYEMCMKGNSELLRRYYTKRKRNLHFPAALVTPMY